PRGMDAPEVVEHAFVAYAAELFGAGGGLGVQAAGERVAEERLGAGDRVHALQVVAGRVELPGAELGVALVDGQGRRVDRAGFAGEGDELVVHGLVLDAV